MRQLAFDISEWLSSGIAPAQERETLASLQITAGLEGIPVTEVYDGLAKTVRTHINVPAYPLAHWLLVNWWKLRWQPGPDEELSPDWLLSHSLAAVGGDTAWPALTFASDGEFIQLRQVAERFADVSAIRYLQPVFLDIPAADFEAAVDALLETVLARLSLRLPEERELFELYDELREERGDSEQTALCRQQALAGLDPGSASQEWFSAVRAIEQQAGSDALDELLATSSSGGVRSIDEAIAAMRASPLRIDLAWVNGMPQPGAGLPWERGAELARAVRQRAGIAPGPIDQVKLGALVGATLPLKVAAPLAARGLKGGYRNGARDGRTAILVPSHHPESQRFYLARLIGAAAMAGPAQHVLPVSSARTAFQKAERSFAQELLCPWQDLKEFLADLGTDDDAIAEAASHFRVSEKVIQTTLVNKHKLPRDQLAWSAL
jgi:hypothetical protein